MDHRHRNTSGSTGSTGGASVDLLAAIRDKLGDLPDRLAAAMRAGRAARFGSPSRERATAEGDDRFGATTGLLSAASPFVPGVGALAAKLQQVQGLVEAFERFQKAFTPAAVPAPVPPPVPPSTVAAYKPYEMKPEGWVPPQPPPLPSSLHPPLPVKPEGWVPPPPKLAENEFAVDPETMAALRAKLNPAIPFKPEGWTPSIPPPPRASPMPTALNLKPEDWRPQPFEMHPADWTPPIQTPGPAVPLAPPLAMKPTSWVPPDSARVREPIAPADLPKLEPRGRGVPTGWEQWPLLPVPRLAEMREAKTKLLPPERRDMPELSESLRSPGGVAGSSVADERAIELLRTIATKLDTLAQQDKERDTGQLPPAPAGEAIAGGSQQHLPAAARQVVSAGQVTKKTGPTGEVADKSIDFARLLGRVLTTAAEL